jgi:hypothetical protein
MEVNTSYRKMIFKKNTSGGTKYFPSKQREERCSATGMEETRVAV